MRIKALLVDDEVNIIKNLQAVIPWESMDIEIVGTARNGEQALDIVRRESPQLILCDIRMPVMDGIGFLEGLRELGSEAEVIMMTGYQDFSYVRSVIRYEVKDYILKPIDYEELAQTVERLARDIRNRSEEQLHVQQQWRRVFHLAYEKVLYDLLVDLGGEASRSFLRERETEGLAFAMMLVDVADYSKKEHLWEEKERKLWNFAVQNILQETLERLGVPHSVLQVRSGEWCVLIERMPPDTFDRIEVLAWAEQLRSSVESYLKLGIRAAIHPHPVPIERLSKAYKSLQRILNLTPSTAEGIIVPEKERSGREASAEPLWDWIEEMVTGLKRCDRRRTERALRGLNDSFRKLPDSSSDRAEPILHYLCLHLLREMRMMDVMSREEEADIWQRLDRNPGIRDTLALINKLVDQSLDSVMKKKTSEVLMLSARDYIERNLSSDLSIDALAEYLGISGSYFSLLFKQHFGETFVEYVTKQRMEMAKSLLALSDKSVTQIGAMVGYSERRYFTRVFSKYTGMLPSEYREHHQNRKDPAEHPSWSAGGDR
jgi:two-component system response regulator YesN